MIQELSHSVWVLGFLVKLCGDAVMRLLGDYVRLDERVRSLGLVIKVAWGAAVLQKRGRIVPGNRRGSVASRRHLAAGGLDPDFVLLALSASKTNFVVMP